MVKKNITWSMVVGMWRRVGYLAPRTSLDVVPCVALCLLAVGCAGTAPGTARVTTTYRSGIEQQLLVRSLERAVAQLDITRFAGRRVALELYALTDDRAFSKDFITAWLEQQGVQVVPDREKSDVYLKVFASVLGVDQFLTFLGVPSFPAPLVGVPVPEIALYKSVLSRGHVEIHIYAYDGRTGAFTAKIPAAIGKARYDDYTILILISFVSTDLDEEAAQVNQ